MLKVVGAGLPRTATMSLYTALPKILDGDCYHMRVIFENHQHIPQWIAAAEGNSPDWTEFFDGYAAAVDWPASVFWEEHAEAFPDAVILLSKRTDGAAWYRSMTDTVLKVRERAANMPPEVAEFFPKDFDQFVPKLWNKVFGADVDQTSKDDCVAAYDRYIDYVRANAPADRLLEWSAPEGWQPLCEALGVPVPDEPFPHVNSTEEFNNRGPERMKEMIEQMKAKRAASGK
ncbi:MAG TPA: sulfotransferase [Stackebrandtia sp.]|jgi:hypothetical protein|uniref:sulfotransferase family protein n=1 Tax=Stackebrandtia sp. TaxID=2023065 RepID=UPI002D482FBE|nr:sulfotransferase [Stackebrandtia sp.]HZE42121.1 sulfotransferase [Stackebrandtia sp.]